jgi:hypothetical protein
VRLATKISFAYRSVGRFNMQTIFFSLFLTFSIFA